MNPDTNKFERLTIEMRHPVGAEITNVGVLHKMVIKQTSLLRPNGEPVPEHWTQFQVGECVVIKNYTFKVAYIGETSILFEPVGINMSF